MNKKGFTLTEILIVIVIAAILVALIAPRALRAIAQANYTSDQANVKSLEEALMLCYADQRDWSKCAAIGTDLVPKYIQATPTHPCQGTYGIGASTTNVSGKEITNTNACTKPS